MRVQIIKHFDCIKELGLNLWQILTVKEIQIKQHGRKEPTNCKYYLCYLDGAPNGTVLLYYNEVKELN